MPWSGLNWWCSAIAMSVGMCWCWSIRDPGCIRGCTIGTTRCWMMVSGIVWLGGAVLRVWAMEVCMCVYVCVRLFVCVTKDCCDLRNAWRGQCGIEVRIISGTAISIVRGEGGGVGDYRVWLLCGGPLWRRLCVGGCGVVSCRGLSYWGLLCHEYLNGSWSGVRWDGGTRSMLDYGTMGRSRDMCYAGTWDWKPLWLCTWWTCDLSVELWYYRLRWGRKDGCFEEIYHQDRQYAFGSIRGHCSYSHVVTYIPN